MTYDDAAFKVADGLARPEIEAHARRAFTVANQWRARPKQMETVAEFRASIDTAFTWRAVLVYLDRTHREVFSHEEFNAWNEHPVQRADIASSPLRLSRWRRFLVIGLGRKPFEFYKFREPAESRGVWGN